MNPLRLPAVPEVPTHVLALDLIPGGAPGVLTTVSQDDLAFAVFGLVARVHAIMPRAVDAVSLNPAVYLAVVDWNHRRQEDVHRLGARLREHQPSATDFLTPYGRVRLRYNVLLEPHKALAEIELRPIGITHLPGGGVTCTQPIRLDHDGREERPSAQLVITHASERV